MKTRTIKIALLSVVCALSAVCAAQGRNEIPNQPYLSLSEQSVWLLDYASLRHSLQLSDEENRAVETAARGYAAQQQRLGAGATDAQIENVDHAYAQSVLSALTPAHRERLFQILLQAKGAEALEDRSVAKKVGLTASESAQVHQILEAADERESDFDAALAKKILAVPRVAPPSLYEKRRAQVVQDAKPERAALAKRRDADEAKALSVLSKSQMARWKELLGVPYPLARYKD